MNAKTLNLILPILLILVPPMRSYACGAFERDYEESLEPLLKYHFYQGDRIKSHTDAQSEENVRLWRSLTSTSIPDSMVVKGLYKINLDSLRIALSTGNTSNSFLKWIYDRKADDLSEFLLLAKELEELRQNRVSAWYYPSDKSGFDEASNEKEKFLAIIDKCCNHKVGRLADRYALQAVRAYISLGEYQNCIDYFNRVLAKYPDQNLFKRMAMGYIAGCYARLGDIDKSDEMFARLGDFVSLSRNDRLEFMADRNPESDRFKTELNYCIGYGDSTDNMRYYRIADIALKSPKTVHRGDWLYLKAYLEKTYRDDTNAALRYVRQALASSFSMSQMREDARFFNICLTPFSQNSLADIKWMLDRRDAAKWERHIPDFVERKELTKALLLANYDTTPLTKRYGDCGKDWHTWANTGFQMLLSCKADDIVRYKQELDHPTMAMTSVLKPNIRHDADYLNEIIGTLYLREGNYRAAARYLSNVSFEYQRQMNVYAGEYLRYNPWDYYYTKADAWDYPWDNYQWEDPGQRPNVVKSKVSYLSNQINAKLNFANEMARLENLIKSETDADKRSLARLRFAIGRYNSLNTCWALTQYWLGASNQCHYGGSCEYTDANGDKVEFFIAAPRELEGLDQWFENEVDDLFKEMKSPESIAEVHLTLRNYRTLAKHFPNTHAGQLIASQCDSWTDWL